MFNGILAHSVETMSLAPSQVLYNIFLSRLIDSLGWLVMSFAQVHFLAVPEVNKMDFTVPSAS